jgi:RNA polymerase sigma-70 factor (ECF subfamily)
VEPAADHDAHTGGGVSLTEFERHRSMLTGLAYRMLGSWHDAEDVLQDAYLRWSRVDQDAVAEPRRYLTRVVTRLALDQLRSRQAKRETYVGEWLPEPISTRLPPFESIDTSELSLGLLHVLERLTPPQRAVYVLRTAFALPYDEIGAIIERTADDCRQLFRRADHAIADSKRRFEPSRREQRALLQGFVAAAREGDLPRLERLLHADVVAWSDGGGRAPAARKPVAGRAKVARYFSHIYSRATAFGVEEIDANGTPALLVRLGDRMTHLLTVESSGGLATSILAITNPDKLTNVRPSRA